ncbi:general transcription factor 3C polypeptide 3 [Cylas formicarius]|uniref:general transcription factor 3C polypeptide 3 n=1 Tax=Cylas formicarius TaxID=197179 RepID=UPI002958D485|nr:general transcription factor 3C polypeptide 3 [Cylas formicarius]
MEESNGNSAQDIEVVVVTARSENGTSDSDSEGGDNDEKRPPKRQISKLPAHLKGLMGEANLRYARRDYETAKKMCFEIIRQAPDAYEPYWTLAQMYENSNFKKYKGFLMLACHVQPSNVNLWCRLAEVELQESQIAEAIDCYSKAIKAEPQNLELHAKRIELAEKKADERLLLVCKLTMAKHMPRRQHERILETCRDVAQAYFREKKYARAVDALRVPLKRIPDKVTHDELNMMLDLLLVSERYSECLDIFTQFFGFTFDVTVESTDSFVVNSYTMPSEDLHIDLKVKFIVCVVRLQCHDLVRGLIDELLIATDVETYGGLHLDVAEALMASGLHREALSLLVPLVKSRNHSLAGVWLRHAECLSACGMPDQAIDAYYTVMLLAPNHVEVLYPLAMLLLGQDKKEEALRVLSQDPASNKLHVAVLVEQMKLLRRIDDLDNYWKCCELLLSRHCVVFRNWEELRAMTTVSDTRGERIAKVKRIRRFRGQDDCVESTLESVHEKSPDEEYELYRDMLQFAYDRRDYAQYQKLCFMGLSSKRFGRHFEEMYLTACHACLFNRDVFHGYAMAREILLHHPSNNLAWNYFSMMAQDPDENRYYKFFQAQSVRDRLSTSNGDLVRHNYLCGTHDCLSFFAKRFRRTGSSYAALMVAVCAAHLCHQKRARSGAVDALPTVAALFAAYGRSRSARAASEVFYNTGRMYQQFGLVSVAERWYQRVLDTPGDDDCVLGLKREAAYNLHLIYKAGGNWAAARNVLMRHVVV